MKEYSYMSSRKNKVATRLSGALFGSAILLLATISVFEVPFLGAFQFACALLFTLAVLVLTRFVFKSFLIKIFEAGEGRYDLTVTECRAKEQITVCRVSLSNIERVVVKTEENSKELRAAQKGRKVYSYCPDLAPDIECFVFVTECGEPLLIKLSPDKTLLDILMNCQK